MSQYVRLWNEMRRLDATGSRRTPKQTQRLVELRVAAPALVQDFTRDGQFVFDGKPVNRDPRQVPEPLLPVIGDDRLYDVGLALLIEQAKYYSILRGEDPVHVDQTGNPVDLLAYIPLEMGGYYTGDPPSSGAPKTPWG